MEKEKNPNQQPKLAGEVERRTFTGNVEFRMDEDGNGDENEAVGYAAEINVETELWTDNYEIIEEGAFDNVLEDDVRALFNHDPNFILARTNNSLKIGVDARGLHYRFEIPETTAGKDLRENLRLKNVTQSSFGFIVGSAEWKQEVRDGRNVWVRHITEIKTLLDVSPVTYPAYNSTEVALRSKQAMQKKKQYPDDNQDPQNQNTPPRKQRRRML